MLELFPDNESLARWIRMAGERVKHQGLPARICWLGMGERDQAGLLFNEMVADGRVSAPLVIGRDHLDCGSVASPYRETEAMADGSDAIADWPLLNALVSTSSGASWVSLHHGGGVGIGRSIHAGQVSVADGTELAAQKLARVLTNDPAMGVLRHVDAGYPEAAAAAEAAALPIPMRRGGADGPRRTGRRPPTRLWRMMLGELADVGRDPVRGGYSRHGFADAELTLREWFVEARPRVGLEPETDGNGNIWAWWDGRRGPDAWSPARTWTRCPAAARSTDRSG